MPPSVVGEDHGRLGKLHVRRYTCALGAVVSILVLAAAPASAAGSSCAPKSVSAKTVSHRVVCLINAERKEVGARKLRRRARLNKVALKHSDKMEERNIFSHLLGGNPIQRILGTGYAKGSSSWEVAETIAWVRPGQGPEAAVKGWLASPYHRGILLDRGWRDVGVGTVKGAPHEGSRGGYTVTATFGRR